MRTQSHLTSGYSSSYDVLSTCKALPALKSQKYRALSFPFSTECRFLEKLNVTVCISIINFLLSWPSEDESHFEKNPFEIVFSRLDALQHPTGAWLWLQIILNQAPCRDTRETIGETKRHQSYQQMSSAFSYLYFFRILLCWPKGRRHWEMKACIPESVCPKNS